MDELSVSKLYLVKLLQDGKKEEDFIFNLSYMIESSVGRLA